MGANYSAKFGDFFPPNCLFQNNKTKQIDNAIQFTGNFEFLHSYAALAYSLARLGTDTELCTWRPALVFLWISFVGFVPSFVRALKSYFRNNTYIYFI